MTSGNKIPLTSSDTQIPDFTKGKPKFHRMKLTTCDITVCCLLFYLIKKKKRK